MLNTEHKKLIEFAAQAVVDQCPPDVPKMAFIIAAANAQGMFTKLGISNKDIPEAREYFQKACKEKNADTNQMFEAVCHMLLGERLPLDIIRASTGEFIVEANRKITKTICRKIVEMRWDLEIDPSPLRERLKQILHV